MPDIASLAIAVDSTQAKTASKTLDELAVSGGKAEQSATALANANAVLSKVYGDLARAAAAWKVYDYIKDATLLNARYETLGISMTQVGVNAGYTANQMEAAARAMQRTGISMTESRASAMKLVQAHIDLADSTKLARIAQDAAVIGGINSSEAFSRLVHGVQTAQVEILRGIGINVSFEEGYAKIAATLGKTAAQLTENEKSQSRLNQVMEKGKEIAGTYEAAMSTAGKQMSSMQRYTEDLKVKIGEVFNETLTIGVMAFTDQMKNLNGEMDAVAANGQLNDWADGVTSLFVTIADNANNLVGAIKVIGLTMAALVAASNLEIWDSAGRSAIKEQYDQDVDAVYAGEDRFSKALEKRRTARAEDAAKLAEIEARKLEQTRSGLIAYAQALEQGLLTQQQYMVATEAIMKGAYGDNHHYSDSAPTPKAAPKGPSEYDTLIKSIQEKIAMDNLDIQTQGQLSSAQKEAAKVREDLRTGVLKLTTAQKIKLGSLLETRIAVDELKGIEDRATKQAQANATARIKANDAAMESYIEMFYASEKGARDAVAAEEAKIAQFGKTKVQIEEMTVATLVLAQTQVKSGTFEYDSLQRQIESRQELIGLMKTSKGLEDKKASSAAEAASWKDIWSSVDRTAHDTFVNIFNGGQDAFTKLRDTLKATLLDLLYQMTIKKWIFDISAKVSGGSVANSAFPGMSSGGGGNLLSTASNANSLYSTGSSVYTVGSQYFGGTMSGANAVGTIGANVTGTGIDGLLATNGAYGTAAGAGAAGAGAAGAGAAGAGAAEAGGAAASGGSALAGAGYFAIAMLVAYGLMNRGGEYVKSTGSANSNFAPDGTIMSGSGATGNYATRIPNTVTGPDGVPHTTYTNIEPGDPVGPGVNNDYAKNIVRGANTDYLNTAKMLGIKTVDTNFTYASNNSDGGKFALTANAGGQHFDSGEIASNDANMKLAAGRAIITALQGSELPEWMSGVFDKLNASTLDQAGVDATIAHATQLKDAFTQLSTIPGVDLTGITYETLESLKGVATELTVVNTAFSVLGYKLFDISAAGGAAAAGLAAAFGGLQNFQAQTAALFQNYYTPAEQRQQTYQSVADGLRAAGITDFSAADIAGASREQIRTVVDSYATKVGTADGDKQYAAIVAGANTLSPLLPSMNGLTTATQGATAAIGGSSGGGGGGGGNSLVSALQGLTDAIFNEVERIRGLIAGDSLIGYAEAQANFDKANSAARLGDKDALSALPGLSQNLLKLADANESTLAGLNYVRAVTASSLTETGTMVAKSNGLSIPSFDVGSDRLGSDGLIMAHKNERITPAAFNPTITENGELRAALNAMSDKLDAAVVMLDLIRLESKRTADITEKSDSIGPAPNRAEL